MEQEEQMELNATGRPMLDLVLQFCQEDQWIYQKMEKKPAIRAGYRGEHGTWIVYASVDEENRILTFYSLLGLNIPPGNRAAVGEYLTRVNYILRVGNFEMDLDTGDVRFRTSLEAPESDPSLAMVRRLAYANVQTIDHYFPGVLAVVHSGLSPEAALARIETQVVGNAVSPA